MSDSSTQAINSHDPLLYNMVVVPVESGKLDKVLQRNYGGRELMRDFSSIEKAFRGKHKQLGSWITRNKPTWKKNRDNFLMMHNAPPPTITPTLKAHSTSAPFIEFSPESLASDDTEFQLARLEIEKEQAIAEKELAEETIMMKEKEACEYQELHRSMQPDLKEQNDCLRDMMTTTQMMAKATIDCQNKLVTLSQQQLDHANESAVRVEEGVQCHKELVTGRLEAAKHVTGAKEDLMDKQEDGYCRD